MTLTVREKEHWKSRIQRRIESAIDEIRASDNAAVFEKIEADAEARAWDSLGLSDLHAELNKLECELEKGKSRKIQIARAMMKEIGVSDENAAYFSGHVPRAVSAKVEQRKKLYRRELMMSEPLSMKVLALESEMDELLDTVWLATSPKQIKELWTDVVELLKQEPTGLQKKAIEIESDSDS